MTDQTPTAPIYRPQTCRRCKGTGEHSWGLCYGCQGRGIVQIECGRRSLTPAEQAEYDEFQTGLDARATREVARRTRMTARRGA